MCSARRRAAALAGSLAVLLSVSGCSAQEELVLSYDNSSALYGMAAQDETASETVDFFASEALQAMERMPFSQLCPLSTRKKRR